MGALTYATKQQAREIAIELALGADARHVRHRIVRQAMLAATMAVGIGLALGIGFGHLASTTLFAIRAAEPVALILSAALVLLVAWVAAVVPAYRASQFPCAVVLRQS
jgi:putative ABC transport system permease protein